jgi:hypothetical protein
LTKLQRAMLLGWALNMTLFAKRENKFGFDYAAGEEARFRAIAGSVSQRSRAFWLGASVVCYFAIGMSFLAFIFTQFPQLPSFIGVCLVIVALLACFPVSVTLAAAVTRLLFRIPPFHEAEGDAALCKKISGQFVLVAAVAVGCLVVILIVQMFWP